MFYNSLPVGQPRRWRSCPGVLAEALRPCAEPADPPAAAAPGAAARCVFEGVRFGYGGRDGAARGWTSTVPAGQTVALVGATGAGKSTVARLAARFYDPVGRPGAAGRRATVDRLDRRRPAPGGGDGDPGELPVLRARWPTTSRSAGPGRPRARRWRSAARAIGADDVRSRRHAGGVRHRGRTSAAAGCRPGQRQLVSFARAFLADPAVLALDEATSSLDVPSERLVQRALRHAAGRPDGAGSSPTGSRRWSSPTASW